MWFLGKSSREVAAAMEFAAERFSKENREILTTELDDEVCQMSRFLNPDHQVILSWAILVRRFLLPRANMLNLVVTDYLHSNPDPNANEQEAELPECEQTRRARPILFQRFLPPIVDLKYVRTAIIEPTGYLAHENPSWRAKLRLRVYYTEYDPEERAFAEDGRTMSWHMDCYVVPHPRDWISLLGLAEKSAQTAKAVLRMLKAMVAKYEDDELGRVRDAAIIEKHSSPKKIKNDPTIAGLLTAKQNLLHRYSSTDSMIVNRPEYVMAFDERYPPAKTSVFKMAMGKVFVQPSAISPITRERGVFNGDFADFTEVLNRPDQQGWVLIQPGRTDIDVKSWEVQQDGKVLVEPYLGEALSISLNELDCHLYRRLTPQVGRVTMPIDYSLRDLPDESRQTRRFCVAEQLRYRDDNLVSWISRLDRPW